MKQVKITLIGGPTVLIEWNGFRILTDPTFDPAGGDYSIGPIVLRKLKDPALNVDDLGVIDFVLLSHEQHSDNLDHLGRKFLQTVKTVYTTPQSAKNISSNAIGLKTWQSGVFESADGKRVIITSTPARHGPEGIEPISGDVTGFLMELEGEADNGIYYSGDTVWYEGLKEIAGKFRVKLAVLNLGAAKLDKVGPAELTMNGYGAVELVKVLNNPFIIPVHNDGWAHWSETPADVHEVFKRSGLLEKLVLLEAGKPILLNY
jgi:L-ascorbate metabolism protein UlaG (beta-lactamase superfamily)